MSAEDERTRAWQQAKQAGKTSQALTLALSTVGKINTEDGIVLCPKCGKAAQLGKKFKMFPDGGWKHFSSQGCFGDAHTVLVESGIPFPDAVRYLAGQPTRTPIQRPSNIAEVNIAPKFVAKVDAEVLNGVLVYGRKTNGVDAAIDFYSTWHISPDAVRESGAVMITDPEHFTTNIVKRFGPDRLVAAGLFTEGRNGVRPLLGENFPLVEPHIHPVTQTPTYMQFRASAAQAARHAEHKAGKRPYAGSEKFLSLRGTPRSSQIGMGLPRVAQLSKRSDVYIVEGFKDLLAARTFGVEAFAIPGVDFRPSEAVCEILSRHNIIVTLDGDDAGAAGRAGLVKYLNDAGITAREHEISNGMDVADKLVLRHSEQGCSCRECVRMRSTASA